MEGSEAGPVTLFCFAWMAIINVPSSKVSVARTGSFPLPKPVVELVLSGVELGVADDQIFGRTDSKKKDGVVGVLSKGVMDRAEYYYHALVLALIPTIQAEIY